MKQKGVDAAIELLITQVNEWGVDLHPKQLALFRRYAELLADYTEANVIGTRDASKIILDHVLDSLSCLLLQNTGFQGKLIDVGAGGGLPGIPLGVVRPDLNVTLLEATKKKAKFLGLSQERLGLTNVKVMNQRAEVAGQQAGLRDSYDIAVSRALASLPVVIEYCAPFVQEGGSVLAMKGPLEEEEIVSGKRAATKLGSEFSHVLEIPFNNRLEQKQRQIVVFRKVAATPTGYPRRIGLAKKRPIGV